MCVGAGNKSLWDPCLPQCWNEAVTRKQGRISARCGLISQGSWPGIERLCHCCTAAAAATAGFLQKYHKKQTSETKQEALPTLPGTCVSGRGVVKWPSPKAKHQYFSVTSLYNILPLSRQSCGVKMIKQQQEKNQLDKTARLSHHINGPHSFA